MAFETTWEPQGIYQKFWGAVSSPELLDALTAIQQGPRIQNLRYIIRDFLSVEVFDAGLKALLEGRAFNMMTQKKNPDIVVAMLATSPQIIQSIRVASSYGLDAYPLKIFDNESEARGWISAVHGQAPA